MGVVRGGCAERALREGGGELVGGEGSGWGSCEGAARPACCEE